MKCSFDFSMPLVKRLYRVKQNGEFVLNFQDGLPVEFAYAADASAFADRVAAYYNSSRTCFEVSPIVVR